MHLLWVFILMYVCVSKPQQTDEYYYRIINHAKDVTNPGNNILAIIDPGHIRAQTFGDLYTVAETNAWTNLTFEFALKHYGMNFYNAEPSPIGSYVLIDPSTSSYPDPYVELLPYADGDVVPEWVVADSEYPDRVCDKNWMVFDVGFLFYFNGSGTFTGGIMANTSFSVGNVIGKTYYNYLDVNHVNEWNEPNSPYREVLATQGDQPGIGLVNSQGFGEQHIKEICTDSHGRKGFGAISVFNTQVGDVVTEHVRTFITFGIDGSFPPPVMTPTPTPTPVPSPTPQRTPSPVENPLRKSKHH